MLIIKDDYFIKVSGNGKHKKYFHFENILSITLAPSMYQGMTYDEASKEHGPRFMYSYLENRIIFKTIFTDEPDALYYGPDDDDITECNSDFEKIIEAHAKYHNKNNKNNENKTN